jgi:hypothetical protein
LHSPSHDTGTFPYLWKQWHSLPLGHPTPSGFNVKLPAFTWFWITDFKDYWISRMIGENVFVLAQWSFVDEYFIPFFSSMRYARIVFFPTGFI